ncbi:MAG: LEA type 2 family protein [Planctomycetes bacterium]|nr:LEA type 2 family protein [Planctomycetota bacterium]
MRAFARCLLPLCLLLATPGCGLLMSIFGRPKVETIHPRVSGIDFEGVGLHFDLEVRNPYWVPLRVPLVRYGLDVQGRELLKSEAPLKVSLPARGVGSLAVPASVSYANLWGAYVNLRTAEEVSYKLHADILFSILGQRFELPVSREGKFPVLRAPRISDVTFRVTEASLVRAVVTIDATMTNPNAFELDVRGLGYDFKAGEVHLAGLKASTSGAIGPGKTGRLLIVGELSAARTVIELLRSGRIEKPSLVPTGTIKTPHGTVCLDRKGKK